MSFRKQFLTALYRFGSYPELIKVKGFKVFLYTLLTAVFAAAVMFCASMPGYLSMGGLEGFAKKYIPAFSIEDGILTMDKIDFHDSSAGVSVFVDTSKEEPDTAKVGDSVYAIAAGSRAIYIYNGMQSETMSFADMPNFGSEDIFNTLSDRNVRWGIISVVVLMWFFGMLMRGIYDIAVLTLIGNIINMLSVRAQIGFADMLKLSSYSRTLPFIMSLLLPIIVGFSFNRLVFYAVGSFYVYKGLKNIKTQTEVVIADISELQNN